MHHRWGQGIVFGFLTLNAWIILAVYLNIFPDYNNKPHGLKYKQNNLHFYFYYENNLPFKGLNSEHIIMFVIWRIWTKGE